LILHEVQGIVKEEKEYETTLITKLLPRGRALGVPNDAAALVASRALGARAAFLDASYRFVDNPELLVVRRDFARLAIHLLEDGEVADKVEQM
jgi:hypothetical protein